MRIVTGQAIPVFIRCVDRQTAVGSLRQAVRHGIVACETHIRVPGFVPLPVDTARIRMRSQVRDITMTIKTDQGTVN